MMTDKRTRKQWVIAAVVLAVLVYSAAGIDYSGLAYFSPSMAGDVFRGLAKPAWGYIYDGSGEDLISLLLLTHCNDPGPSHYAFKLIQPVAFLSLGGQGREICL